MIFGTTGEAVSFSVEERIALLEAALSAGLPPERLMVGTGCCALTDTVRLTTHTARMGCTTTLMLPPFYYKNLSPDGLFRSYAEVIDRVGDGNLRVFAYHFPKLSGVPILPDVLARLQEAFPENIVGIKDSSGSWTSIREFIAGFPELCIFAGTETFLLRGLREGGAGCISATANVNPHGIRRVYEAWRGGSTTVDSLLARATHVREVIESMPMIAALKYLIAHKLKDAGWRRVRPPLSALEEAAGQALLASLGGTEQ